MKIRNDAIRPRSLAIAGALAFLSVFELGCFNAQLSWNPYDPPAQPTSTPHQLSGVGISGQGGGYSAAPMGASGHNVSRVTIGGSYLQTQTADPLRNVDAGRGPR